MSLTSPTPKYLTLLALSALVALSACGGGSDDEVSAATTADESRSEALARRRTPPPPPPPPAPPPPAVDSSSVGPLALVSSTAAGQATGGYAICGISADGNLVVFRSGASNLVANDTNGQEDVFLKDLRTGAVQRINTSSSGAPLGSAIGCAQLTPDGRFALLASNGHVLVKNIQTGALTQVSPAIDSIPNNTGFSAASISDDGNVVTLVTIPTTVYVGAYNFVNTVPARILVRNIAAGTLTTLNTDNGRTADGQIFLGHLNARLSPDGTRVAFVSNSSTLVAGDTNGAEDVFVRNLATGVTTRATSTSNGTGLSSRSIFYNVEWVNNSVLQFSSDFATNLGPRGEYLKNVDTDALQLLLEPPLEGTTIGGSNPVVSADLRTLVFSRGYANSGFDHRLFTRDLTTGLERVVSSSASGVLSNGNVSGPRISRDGARVVFQSNASNIFSPAPPVGSFQIYVKSFGTP